MMNERLKITASEKLKLVEKATDVAAEGIIVTDALKPDNPIIYVNEGFVRLTGYSKEEILGNNCRFLQGEKTNPDAIEEIRAAIREERHCLVELINYRKDGTPFWNRLSIAPIKDHHGKITHFVGVQSDITELKTTRDRLEDANKELKKFHKEMIFQLEQAKKAQEFLLPTDTPQIPGVKIAYKFVPLAHIGGDFFDVINLSEKSFGILVADVTGHGIAAALLSFMSSITFKNVSPNNTSPKDVFNQTNDILFGHMPGGTFVSMLYMIYDVEKKELTFSLAGHPPAFLIRTRQKKVVQLNCEGMLIGIFPNGFKDYHECTVQLESGDKVLLYTDAFIEAFSEDGEMLELSGFKSILDKHLTLSIDKLLDVVYEHALEFVKNNNFDDDATLIGFEVE